MHFLLSEKKALLKWQNYTYKEGILNKSEYLFG